MEFEEVEYWDELTAIMDWSVTNVTSTLHICWGAQAGLYYRYGVKNTSFQRSFPVCISIIRSINGHHWYVDLMIHS